jgi:signal transduction histidine kinase
MAADVRRFTATLAMPSGLRTHTVTTIARPAEGPQPDRLVVRDAPLSIVVQETATGESPAKVTASQWTAAVARAQTGPRWRLLVTHPSGSLEAAVNEARRRNLLISSSILGVLAASMALLVLTTRRSQEVARQQMEFVAAVSHELRTPLAVIRSAGDNLAEGVVGDLAQARKYGDLVRGEGRRLSEMVEQILEFAGIQSGQRRFAPRPVGVRGLLHAVVAASASLLGDARMAVEYDVPDGLPPVLGDEPALRRVFQNLVGNAIKYGAGGGWLGLRARVSGREVRITVADRGIGIPPAEQARIFEPFYRAADVVAAQIQGAGLGLSLVTRILEAHGGRITVESAPGRGSAFTVHLPAAAAYGGEPAVEPEARPHPEPS